jgi:hypothetical protein
MSWWIRRKDKDGKTYLWAVDVDPMSLLILFGLILAIILPNAYGASNIFMVSGFLCFLISKVSVFRQGVLISWGPSRMAKGYATLYRAGYVLMLAGVFICLIAWGSSIGR